MESEIDSNTVEIKDALTCFICALKVTEPLMCPKCRKMACSKCIKKWFDEDHDKCPYCQTHSSYDNMISLPFMDQISQFFMNEIKNKKSKQKEMNKIIDEDDLIDESGNYNNINNINNVHEDDENYNQNYLSKTHFIPNKFKNENENNNNAKNMNNNEMSSNIKKGETCPKHKNELIEYYCINCNTKHCSKCFLFFSEESKNHQDHKIIPIDQKNKFKIDEIKEEIINLSNVIKDLKEYKDNIEMEKKMDEKKEEFINKIIEEFRTFFNQKIDTKNSQLNTKNELISNQLDKIFNVQNNYSESLENFISHGDEQGFKEYHQLIKNFKDTKRFEHSNNISIHLNPILRFFETDFIDIEINEYEEIMGEIYFNIEGINKQLHFKLNGQTFDEVLINLQIELNDLTGEKERYYGNIIFNNRNKLISISLDEKMVDNGILILGRTIIKSGLSTIVDENHKCHIKLFLAHFYI